MWALEDKVRLLTGATAWRLHGIPAIGLRPLVLSDGPVGVRGTGERPGETSLLFPSPSALAATWDVRAAAALGAVFAREARRHGVDVVLAPQVNIQRTPVAGRHFECYSEDPLLTGELAAAMVTAIQAQGVAASPKHFVANDSETGRTRLVARVDEQALREVYLAPFERAVVGAGAWAVMSAYNGVDDGAGAAPMTEHGHLLLDLLKGEWGFDGVVVSDWLAARRTAESALGGLDLVMPGPGGPWEEQLVAAVRDGRVPEAVIDDKVGRLLLLAARVGARSADVAGEVVRRDLIGHPDLVGGAATQRGAAGHPPPSASGPPAGMSGEGGPAGAGDVADDAGFLRGLAARSVVVLKRGATFPVPAAGLRRVALVGPNAVEAHVLGGGSSSVTPAHVVSPLEGLRNALPGVAIDLRRGGDARRHPPGLDVARRCRDPRGQGPGLRVSHLGADGEERHSEVVTTWDGWVRELPDEVDTVVVDAVVHLAEPGAHRIEVGTVGRHRVLVDGDTVSGDDTPVGAEVILDSTVNSPDGRGAVVTGPRTLRLTAQLGVIRGEGYGNQVRGALRHRPPGPDAEQEIADAVAAARAADRTVVVVGTNEEVESEGWDRQDLRLPGQQDELVARVLDAAPDAVVVVNAGAPVVLPWLDRAQTVLWSWFPGQECGDALADVLLGRREPAGRLPWTLPAREEDVPVPHARPGPDGVLDYHEGVHVGYRGWERARAEPAAPFGHGLGWTDWRYDATTAPVLTADGGLALDVTVTNTGGRPGTEVVQVYLEPPHRRPDCPDRPVRWLAGFATVRAEPGRTVTTTVNVPCRALEVWDTRAAGWVLPGGRYRVLVGRSVRDIRLRTQIAIVESSTEAQHVKFGGA